MPSPRLTVGENGTFCQTAGDYCVMRLDKGRRPADVIHYVNYNGADILIADKRETDEEAMYEIME